MIICNLNETNEIRNERMTITTDPIDIRRIIENYN